MVKIDEQISSGISKDPLSLVDPIIKDYFLNNLKHKQLAPVQICTLRYMLANFDCVVQAPTGSGKSLAFMLPALQILVQKKLTNVAEDPKVPSEHLCRICALVVAPGRDLVVQLWHLFSPLCKKLGLNALKLHGAGGERKKSAQNPKKHMKGQCVLICTPGRFENFLEKEPELKKYLKHLEVLVIDEADRYSDRESMSSLTTLLAALPKQRRTALFSATQSAGIEQLLRFGLRNPTRLHVSADTGEVCTDSTGFDVATSNDQQNGETEEGHQTKGGVVPTELSIFYTCVPAELKLLALVKFLRSQKRAKVLIFVSNASQAEYFSLIVPQLLKKDGTDSAGAKERPVLSLHRKMEQKREKVLELFRSTDRCVLFTTDLLARGIDVPKIDWVLHFDIPKLSRVFIHRCGRSARMGRAGRSLLLLMPEEEAYVQFMHTSAGVNMEQCQIETLTEERAVQLRERVQRQSIEDRKILELGSSAFVSYIEAYNRHDCQIICKVKDLNIVGVANAFGLLRMPVIREFRNRTDILRAFQPRMDVRTSEIKYKDEKLEAKRTAMLEQRAKQKMEEVKERQKHRNGRVNGSEKQWAGRMHNSAGGDGRRFEFGGRRRPMEGGRDGREKRAKMVGGREQRGAVPAAAHVQNEGKRRGRRAPSEWEQLQKDEGLLRKFRRAKLSRTELDERMDEGGA